MKDIKLFLQLANHQTRHKTQWQLVWWLHMAIWNGEDIMHTGLGKVNLLTQVYCICNQVYSISYHVHHGPRLGVLHLLSSVLHMPSSNIKSNTGAYYISHQVYCRWQSCQEPHLGVLHLQSSVQHILSCSSGASLGCTAFASRLRWIYHQVYCISYHAN